MNGRLYDPILRRFLNADENIQDPENTQVYNKYGYVMNNPLMFTDADGEFFIAAIIIGAVFGAWVAGSKANGTMNPLKWNWGKTWDKIALGAVIGGVSGAAGAWAGQLALSIFSASATSVVGGAIFGAASGLVGGAIGGGFMAALFNEPILKGAFNGAWQGAVFGGILGAATNYIRGVFNTTPSPTANAPISDAKALKIPDPNIELYTELQELVLTGKKGLNYIPKMLQQVESALSNLRINRVTAVDANTGKAISNGVVEAAEVGGGNSGFNLSKSYIDPKQMSTYIKELESGFKNYGGNQLSNNHILTRNQLNALSENLRQTLIKTIPNAKTSQSIINQLANPRWRFIDQIPGGRDAINEALKGTDIIFPY
jgi:hypothetical protein